MNDRVDGGRLARAALRKWWLVVALTVVGAGAGYAIASATSPVYAAETSVLVGNPTETHDVTKEVIDTAQQLAGIYADTARREPVLAPVVESLGLKGTWQQLSSRVHVSLAPGDPQLIVITVDARSKDEATRTAAAIADRLVALGPATDNGSSSIRDFVTKELANLQAQIENARGSIQKLSDRLAVTHSTTQRQAISLAMRHQQQLIIRWQGSYSALLQFLQGQSATSNSLQVLEPAQAAPRPVRPNTRTDLALGGFLGLLVALGLAYLLEYRREEDVEIKEPPSVIREGAPFIQPRRLPEAVQHEHSGENPNPPAWSAMQQGRSRSIWD